MTKFHNFPTIKGDFKVLLVESNNHAPLLLNLLNFLSKRNKM